MGKKDAIVVSLVEESTEKSNREIEKEIMSELSKEPARIPWLKKVERHDFLISLLFSHFFSLIQRRFI